MRYAFTALAFLLCACAAPQKVEAPFRSPTQDYDPPTARSAADGEAIGVDDVRPADTLATEGAVGTGGFRPAERPPSVVDAEKERAREQRRVCAGSDEVAMVSPCPPAPSERR